MSHVAPPKRRRNTGPEQNTTIAVTSQHFQHSLNTSERNPRSRSTNDDKDNYQTKKRPAKRPNAPLELKSNVAIASPTRGDAGDRRSKTVCSVLPTRCGMPVVVIEGKLYLRKPFKNGGEEVEVQIQLMRLNSPYINILYPCASKPHSREMPGLMQCAIFDLFDLFQGLIVYGHGKFDQFQRPQLVQLVAEHISNALSRMHCIGIAHCDVKPENVLVFPSRVSVTIDMFQRSAKVVDAVERRVADVQIVHSFHSLLSLLSHGMLFKLTDHENATTHVWKERNDTNPHHPANLMHFLDSGSALYSAPENHLTFAREREANGSAIPPQLFVNFRGDDTRDTDTPTAVEARFPSVADDLRSLTKKSEDLPEFATALVGGCWSRIARLKPGMQTPAGKQLKLKWAPDERGEQTLDTIGNIILLRRDDERGCRWVPFVNKGVPIWVDARSSDVFSFGVMLITLMLGQPILITPQHAYSRNFPYERTNLPVLRDVLAEAQRVAHNSVEALRTHGDVDIPCTRFDSIIDSCIRIDATKRATMAEVVQSVEALTLQARPLP